MKKTSNITEDHIDLMYNIEKNSGSSQREIAINTGLSIGKVNYILKSLVEGGLIKIKNFRNADRKLNYLYVLTPKGIREKTIKTKQFIVKKKQEYDRLNSYLK